MPTLPPLPHIIGAGPAGAALAYVLAARGVAVTLADALLAGVCALMSRWMR